MKRVLLALLAAAFVVSCDKAAPEHNRKQEEEQEEKQDTSVTPDPPAPVVEKHMALSDTLDGFHYVAYHIRNFRCHKIYYASSWQECVDSLNLLKGEAVAVVAYSDSSNIAFIPHEAGERKTEYYFAPAKPGLGFPEVWSGFANVAAPDSFYVEMTKRTVGLTTRFINVPSDCDSVVVELPEVRDVFHPCQDTFEKGLTTYRLNFNCRDTSFNMLPMPFPGKAIEVPVTFYYKDRYRNARIHLDSRVGEGESATAEFSMSEPGVYGMYQFKAGVLDKSGIRRSSTNQKLSLWDHRYDSPRDYTKTDFPIQSGVNLGWRFGSGITWNADGTPWLGWNHDREVNMYCDCGFDHFRVPIDEDCLVYPETGEERPLVRDNIKKMVDIAIGRGCRVIIDLHWLFVSQTFPNPDAEEHFRNCWRILHDIFKDYPVESLAYEVLNEPNCPDDYWHFFMANSIDMIRDWGGLEKNRVIVCACNHGQDIKGMYTMELPAGDPNLILSYHDYFPSAMTFHGPGEDGYWGDFSYPGKIISDEIYYSLSEEQRACADRFRPYQCYKGDLENLIKSAAKAGSRLGVPVFCGEYGCNQGVNIETRVAYFKDRCELFRKYGMSYCNWFLLGTYPNEDMPDEDIVAAMVVKK